jgi:hypothetical protein
MSELLKNHRADPTGYATLRRVLGEPAATGSAKTCFHTKFSWYS